MAKTLNQQVRLIPPAPGGTDPIADNGGPDHARLLFDGPRDLNNMASYVEPSFQFAMSQGGQIGAPIGTPQTWWVNRSPIPASGQAFICQMPILVPHQATRLLWTAGVERGSLTLPETLGPQVRVSGVTLYLSPVPFRTFTAGQSVNYLAASSEMVGNFTDASMPTKFAKHTLAVSFTSSAPTVVSYDFADDTTTGWTDFAKDPSVFTSSLLLTGGPVSWLIVAATYTNAVVNDFIRVRDFSFWGQYE